MRSIFNVFIIAICCLSQVRANEGMWILSLLNNNYDEMQSMGLKLTPEDIYSINNSSLKDAIGGLGEGAMVPENFFCTSEVISNQGLMLTNHHCAYDLIQKHSTVENDYLQDGFWAKTKDQELSNPEITVSFLVKVQDVTFDVIGDIPDSLSYMERKNLIHNKINEIIQNNKDSAEYDVTIKEMFEGNQFFMFAYQTYRDVRLVGAPPSSIGKFGNETDNWMWPRHTGDFSLLRVYTAPDGSPAEYAKENIPYKPAHSIPISIKGVEENDFAMILGFPGATDRYITSFGMEQKKKSNEIRVDVRTKKLEILREEMALSKDQLKKDSLSTSKVHIQYASKAAQCSNYWKYSIGQNKGLRRLGVVEKERIAEKDFDSWVGKDSSRKERYGDVLSNISLYYSNLENVNTTIDYLSEAFYAGVDLVNFSYSIGEGLNILHNYSQGDSLYNVTFENVQNEKRLYFKDFDIEVEKKLFSALFELYSKEVPILYQPKLLIKLNKKYQKDYSKLADKIYDRSIFSDENRFDDFLAKPNLKKLIKKDLGYKLKDAIIGSFFDMYGLKGRFEQDFKTNRRLYLEGKMKMDSTSVSYSDANSTIRLTYGKVADYVPRDAVKYNYYTELSGVIQKEDKSSHEFYVPEKLIDLYNNKDFGRYQSNGTIPVCFLTDNDITGGNSGSPVINGSGELIGLAFDGNWEAMSSDIRYINDLQRTISVDIRYVLFIIEKYAGATNIIEELNIVE